MPSPLGVHDDVGAAVRLAQHDAQARNRRLRVRVRELRAVADHAPPLEVLARLEARGVDERDDRQVERVAPLHEARAPCATRRCRARPPVRTVGSATTPTVRPSRCAEPDDDARRVVGPELEQRVGVDDVAHHDRARRTRRSWRTGTAPRRLVQSRSTMSSRRPRRRVVEVVRREVLEQRGERVVGVSSSSSTTSEATPVVCPWIAEPPSACVVERDARELRDGVRPADVGERVGRHDHVVDEPEAQRRAGHARAGHDDDRRHDARRVDERPGAPAPPVQRADALADVRAGGVEPGDERDAELGGEADRPLHRLGAGLAHRAVVLAAFDPQLDDRTAVDARRCERSAAVAAPRP